jgi:low temperature requirement protein LtrA
MLQNVLDIHKANIIIWWTIAYYLDQYIWNYHKISTSRGSCKPTFLTKSKQMVTFSYSHFSITISTSLESVNIEQSYCGASYENTLTSSNLYSKLYLIGCHVMSLSGDYVKKEKSTASSSSSFFIIQNVSWNLQGIMDTPNIDQ